MEATQFEKSLKEFNALVKDSSENNKNVTKQMEDLKVRAIAGVGLNGRQGEALLARCNNFINGTYGDTKKNVKFGDGK